MKLVLGLILTLSSCSLLASENDDKDTGVDNDGETTPEIKPAPKPDVIAIENLQAIGSGCPKGTVIQNVAEDGQSFVLYFSDFVAELGDGIKKSEGRKSCQINLNLKHSPGWRFSVVEFDFNGYAFLDEEISADYQTNYYFQGDLDGLKIVETMNGPVDGAFYIEQTSAPTEKYWSNCDKDRAININTVIKLQKGENAQPYASGLVTTDSLDGTLGIQTWRLSWEKCPEEKVD